MNNRLYEQRLARFKKLIQMNAPKSIIGNEALLIAMSILSKEQLSKQVNQFLKAEPPENPENN